MKATVLAEPAEARVLHRTARRPAPDDHAPSGRDRLSSTRVVGNQAMQRARLAPAGSEGAAPMLFPHRDRLAASLGAAAFDAVLDPAGCAAAGVPAFTRGATTHFATPAPSLGVAAHEAAHQLQHAGRTHDAGLGAEGHAQSVAHAVETGRSAAPLLGRRGAPVHGGLHTYTSYEGGRLADDETAWVGDKQSFFATPGHIAGANAILRAKRSGVELVSQGGSKSTPSGQSLSQATAKFALEDDELWADCGKAAREVMGPSGKDEVVHGVFTDEQGNEYQTSRSSIMRKDPREALALIIYTSVKLEQVPGYQDMNAEDRQYEVELIREEWEAFDDEEKKRLIDEYLDLVSSGLSEDTAQKIGVDAYALPNVGEAYTIRNTKKAVRTDGEYHWAAVVLAAGNDRVTLENFGHGDYDVTNENWYFAMYGARPDQSYHAEWKDSFGGDAAHTIVARNQSDPSAAMAIAPSLSTRELLEAWEGATDEVERQVFGEQLGKRSLSIKVTVVEGDEDVSEISPYVLTNGNSASFPEVDMSAGDTKRFVTTLEPLMPLGSRILVYVWEHDLTEGELIIQIPWDSPFPLVGAAVNDPDVGAYTVSLRMG